MKKMSLSQRGAAAVEFGLTLSFYLLLLLGIIEFARFLYIYNSAVEATRAGARTAVVSTMNSPDILQEMRLILEDLTADQIAITYLPLNCVTDCAYVQIALNGYSVTPIFWPHDPIVLPPFTTTLPAESLGNNN
ncbi:MAG: pilus assembly protein [Burkholderiales bacterium]|nr:pilus assembly protein [Burkholderiales bacterium]